MMMIVVTDRCRAVGEGVVRVITAQRELGNIMAHYPTDWLIGGEVLDWKSRIQCSREWNALVSKFTILRI